VVVFSGFSERSEYEYVDRLPEGDRSNDLMPLLLLLLFALLLLLLLLLLLFAMIACWSASLVRRDAVSASSEAREVESLVRSALTVSSSRVASACDSLSLHRVRKCE